MLSKILNQSMIKIESETYLSVFIIIAAMLNFLAGINIDMYAPSMPAIAHYFSVSYATVKSTIAINIFGWSMGCIIFGAFIDAFGRKPVIIFGLFGYTIASLIAIDSHTFFEFYSMRFLQGFMVSTVTIGCRTLIIDRVIGNRYAIAMLYASLAYSCGAVFGPFIGGTLQTHFGWQENFIMFAIVAFILFFAMFIMIDESISEKQPLFINKIFLNYLNILKNKSFVAGVFVVTLSNIELMLYPTIGPFIVENKMHFSAGIYGETALIVSTGYLSGTLLCRYLLRFMSSENIYRVAFFILLSAVLIAWIFYFVASLNLWTLLPPMIMLNITVGLITPNIIGANLKLMPNCAGIAMAIQVAMWAFLTAVGIFIVSHATMNNLFHLAMMYFIFVFLQWVVYFQWYRRCNDEHI